MAGSPIREPIIDSRTGKLSPVWERYFVLTLTPMITRLLEEIPTNFETGSVPFVKDGFLAEDITNLNWDASGLILSALNVIIGSLTPSRLIFSNPDKMIESVDSLTSWIAGTINQITVTDNLDGTVTLSTPQDIDTAADVEFNSATIGDTLSVGTSTPDTSFQVVGDAKLGEDTTNYIEIKSDGELNLHGTARVRKEIILDAGAIKALGANPATLIAHGVLEIPAFQFANATTLNQNTVSFAFKRPVDLDATIAVSLLCSWSSSLTGNTKWQLEYAFRSLNEDTTVGAEYTITKVAAASATSNGLVFTEITGINLPDANDIALICKLTRLSGDVQDTITTTTELQGVLVSYTSDRLGESL